MGERLITERQEQALRLVHHDFECLTQQEAAEKMGITQSTLSGLLAAVEKVLPQYFPILTKLEIKCYHLFATEGWSVDSIAVHLDKSQKQIYDALTRAKNKGQYFSGDKRKTLSYDTSMDADVREQF